MGLQAIGERNQQRLVGFTLRETNQSRVVHQDGHDLDEIVGLPPVIRIGAVQFLDVLGFDPSTQNASLSRLHPSSALYTIKANHTFEGTR